MKTPGLLILSLLFFACNQGSKTKTISKDSVATSINEQTYVELGGEKQYVEVIGQSEKNPVLLFIHGGPGWPQTPQLRYFNSALAKQMTLVSWDQPGCGKSILKDSNTAKISLDQFVEDAHDLTQWLKKKYNKQQIYVAGFSWGSIVGLTLIQKYPGDYKAYFGISQVLNVKQSIKRSRKWIAEKARAAEDEEALKILNRLDKKDKSLCQSELECFMKQYEVLSKYHGAVHSAAADSEINKSLTYYPDYKAYDWNKGFMFSATRLQKDLFGTDLSKIKEVQVPVCILAGRHDWNIPGELTEAWFDKLQAPAKEFIWFENSGHEIPEEEAKRFNIVLNYRVR
ncbi:MAG: hypothetical protein C5B52_02820 [Bacteroidetes bacterium]|nr:MAG: hypothetical protein C5B52_02820 [Bacteroidota bacterium]